MALALTARVAEALSLDILSEIFMVRPPYRLLMDEFPVSIADYPANCKLSQATLSQAALVATAMASAGLLAPAGQDRCNRY
jgi:hypothetical protein